jgi:tetratricopeptide (TPR) repeat protein
MLALKNLSALSRRTNQLVSLNLRMNSDEANRGLNIIQQNESYQKALEFAHDKDYDKSIHQLRKAKTQISSLVGANNNFEIYINQRIASLQQMKQDIDGVEETFQECITIAENSKINSLVKPESRTQNVFVWQNNLLKFYLEHNISKAIDFGNELIEDIAPILPEISQQDLKFSVATAHSLICSDLDTAISLYGESIYGSEVLEKNPGLSEMHGIVFNNLGITHFYKFIELSS